MKTYQPYVDFTAQGLTVRALLTLYSKLEDQHDPTEIELLPFVVFMAFSIEAYLNSVGARSISYWDELERLPWKSKVSILHQHVGKVPAWGSGPLQFCSQVFKIRDKLAHGKPERVTGPVCVSPADAYTYIKGANSSLEPDWYKLLTKEWVMSAKAKHQELMEYISSLYGLGKQEHLRVSTGSIMELPGGMSGPAGRNAGASDPSVRSSQQGQE